MINQFVICVLLVFTTWPALAQTESLKTVDPTNPFAKLTGQVTQFGYEEKGYGNAFVVGADGCHILTNFHVAFGTGRSPVTGQMQVMHNADIGHAVNFSFELDPDSGKFRRSMKATVAELGDYGIGSATGLLGDIAILRLENCLGKSYGFLEIDRPPPHKGVPTNRLMTVRLSKTASGGNEVIVELGCRALEGTNVFGMMPSNCDTPPGSSGSMVLEEGADGKWRLVGLTTEQIVHADGRKFSKALYANTINKLLDPILGTTPPTESSSSVTRR